MRGQPPRPRAGGRRSLRRKISFAICVIASWGRGSASRRSGRHSNARTRDSSMPMPAPSRAVLSGVSVSVAWERDVRAGGVTDGPRAARDSAAVGDAIAAGRHGAIDRDGPLAGWNVGGRRASAAETPSCCQSRARRDVGTTRADAGRRCGRTGARAVQADDSGGDPHRLPRRKAIASRRLIVLASLYARCIM